MSRHDKEQNKCQGIKYIYIKWVYITLFIFWVCEIECNQMRILVWCARTEWLYTGIISGILIWCARELNLPGETLIVTKTEAARASGLASEASIVSLYTILSYLADFNGDQDGGCKSFRTCIRGQYSQFIYNLV